MTLCDLCGFITMAEDDVSLLGRNKESRGTNWGKNWSSKLRGSALGLSLSPSQPFRIPSKSFQIPQKITTKQFPQHHIIEDQSRWCNPFGSQSGVKMSGRMFGDYSRGLKITLRSLLQWISAAWVFSIWDQGLLAIHELTAEQIQLAIQALAVVRQSINSDSNARAGPGPPILRCVR